MADTTQKQDPKSPTSFSEELQRLCGQEIQVEYISIAPYLVIPPHCLEKQNLTSQAILDGFKELLPADSALTTTAAIALGSHIYLLNEAFNTPHVLAQLREKESLADIDCSIGIGEEKLRASSSIATADIVEAIDTDKILMSRKKFKEQQEAIRAREDAASQSHPQAMKDFCASVSKKLREERLREDPKTRLDTGYQR